MEAKHLGKTEEFRSNDGDGETRSLSTIQFPYGDLETGIEVVRMIHSEIGGVWCTPDQLAAAMGQTPKSGNFRLKTSTARIFGLIETSQGRIDITELGFEIIDPGREKAAKVKAFLNVELFRKVYEDYHSKQLPPRTAAFERMLQQAGVAPKQKANARRALDNSAEQAGFYKHGKDRLVAPHIESGEVEQHKGIEHEVHEEAVGKPSRKSGGDDGGSYDAGQAQYHPFIQGLLKTLPEPETNWAVEGRAKWLQAAANIFDLMYKGSGQITVAARHEPDSPKEEPETQ